MSIRYVFLPTEHLLITQYIGRTDPLQHNNHAAHLRKSLTLGDRFNIISDLNAWTETTIRARDMSQRATGLEMELARGPTRARHAIYAPTVYGHAMGRMFLGLSSANAHHEARLFQDADLAATWLGLAHSVAKYLHRNDWHNIDESGRLD